MIDSHCHLYLEDFDIDIENVMERAISAGVSRFYLPAIDSKSHERMLQLEKKYKDSCFAMIGLHPCSVKTDYKEEIKIVKHYLSERNFSAIGEIGLDFYWDKSNITQQHEAFHEQLNLAIQYSLPVSIHSRDATDECIEAIEQYAGRGLKGIFHCFGGTVGQADRIIASAFLLGIGGVITYKKSGLAEVLKNIDLEHIVLETDAPYLSPVPHRGKRNESSYLSIVADKLATVKNIPVTEIHATTDTNCRNLFKATL